MRGCQLPNQKNGKLSHKPKVLCHNITLFNFIYKNIFKKIIVVELLLMLIKNVCLSFKLKKRINKIPKEITHKNLHLFLNSSQFKVSSVDLNSEVHRFFLKRKVLKKREIGP